MWPEPDLAWLGKGVFPLELKGNFIEGWIAFRALYDGRQVIINPTPEEIAALTDSDKFIEDSYKVRIRWRPGFSIYPFTEEIGGRVEALSAKLGKRLADLHVYESFPNFLCDSGPRDLYRAFSQQFSLERYVLEFLIPRLYAQSYYERLGEWPWGELSHNFLGLFEWFARAISISLTDLVGSARDIIGLIGESKFFYLISKKYGSNHRCVCSAGLDTPKVKDCHVDVWRGIQRMRETMRGHNLTLPGLIDAARQSS